MTLNSQPIERQDYSPPTGLNWKWEKRHCLLIISGICLLLWWLGSQGKVTWMEKANSWLPLVGGLALVGEQLLRLI